MSKDRNQAVREKSMVKRWISGEMAKENRPFFEYAGLGRAYAAAVSQLLAGILSVRTSFRKDFVFPFDCSGTDKRADQIDGDADANRAIGDIEGGPGEIAEMEVEKIDHIAVADPVDHIS